MKIASIKSKLVALANDLDFHALALEFAIERLVVRLQENQDLAKLLKVALFYLKPMAGVNSRYPEAVRSGFGNNPFFPSRSSAKVGFEKPHPQIFHYAIEVAGANNVERWMVGDNPIAAKFPLTGADIEGAERVGISSVLVRSNGNSKLLAKDLLEVEKLK